MWGALVDQEKRNAEKQGEIFTCKECEFDLPGADCPEHVVHFYFMATAVNNEHADSPPAANLFRRQQHL